MKTARTVLFSGDSGPLREGTAVDVSSTGVQIRCVRPEPDGTKLDAEILANPNNPDSLPIAAQGRVAHVRKLETGEFAMGVELSFSPVARKDLNKAPILFRKRDATSPKRVGLTPRSSAGPDHSRNRRRRRWLGLLCLALLFLAVLFLMGRLDRPVSAQGKGSGEPVQRDEEAPLTTQVAPSGAGSIGLRSDGDADVALVGKRHPIRRFSGRFGQPVALAGEGNAGDGKVPQPPAALPTGKDETKPARTRPSLALIMTSWGAGEEQPSMRASRRGSERPRDGVVLALDDGSRHQDKFEAVSAPALTATEPPEAYSPGVVESRGSEEHAVSDGAGMVRNRERLLRPIPRVPETAQHDVFLVVDKGRFLMTVFVRGAPVRQFPVGVGRNNSTPTGRFQVVNKLSDPDWYHRGETVPAADPRNPLGKRWLGLASCGVPTGYGLHPTKEAGSVGRPASHGCIRLRPEDAETLFRLCPVGTPVEICG